MDKFISLGLLLNRAATAISSVLNNALLKAGIDLPHSQFTVLRCLYYNGELSQLEIARLLSKDAAAIKRTVDNLEQKGLVTRIPVRTLKNSIRITDTGMALMPEVTRIAEEVTSQALISFGHEEKEMIMNGLDKIITNLSEK